jgi:hypothetical protein
LAALLLAQLLAVDRLAPAAPGPVLARRVRPAALEPGLAVDRALALEEELDALASREPLDRSRVASHPFSNSVDRN